jgi:hypothetical protein
MPIDLTEADLVACGKIQELKTTTIAKAKEIYRKHVAALANPDVEGRAEIVFGNIQRGAKSTQFDTDGIEETPVKAKKEKKVKAPKVKKAKAEKKTKKAPKSERAPRVEVPLPALEREVELKPVEELAHVFTANLFGKKTAVILAERNRLKVAGRFQAIGFSEKYLDAAVKYGKSNDLPVAVCAQVRVNGRVDQGYAIPLDVFSKFKCKEGIAAAVNLRGDARAAYENEGWAGVRFIEFKAQGKAA